MKTPDTQSKRPHQRGDFRGEWDAIKQSFSDMFADKVSIPPQASKETNEFTYQNH